MAGALTDTPAVPERTAHRRGSPVAWSVGIGVGLLALSLRLPHLGVIPRFTDETDVVVRALAVARGQFLPLTDTDAYIGAGFGVLLAGALRLFGPDPVLPRYVAMIVGSLTVGAVFLLGRGQRLQRWPLPGGG